MRSKGGQPLDPDDGRTDGPSPRIAVRLPLWLHERLEDAATRRGTTPSDVVREALAALLGDGDAT